MNTPSDLIASKTKNCSFNLQSIQKFLALMSTQQPDYSDISYKANGPFTLVLRAKKNGNAEVALKVLECTEQTDCQIQAMERECAILKQLPSSNYLMTIQNQFYLTDMNERAEQSQSLNSNTTKKVYFVQQMEMCQGSLHDTIFNYSEKNKDLPTQEIKELLAIQMLDAVNLLHQRHLSHGSISTQHCLVSSSYNNQILLKLCNHKFTSPLDYRNQINLISGNESLSNLSLLAEIQRECSQQDLVSLGKVLLQLDNIGTDFDYSTISYSSLAQLGTESTLKTHKLNQNTFLYQIASILLNTSRENSQSARSMLLLLLQKQTSALKIPLFSVVLKGHVDSLCLSVPYKRIILDNLAWQMSKQRNLNKIDCWFDNSGQRKTELTETLLKSALNIILEWKEFSEVFDVLGVGVGGVVFGVENLKEKRKSALKLSLCTNKSQIIREVGIRRICQTPYIIKFYGHKFFKDSNGNEFVVYEFERCKYSLIHHLEMQKIYGQYSDEQKYMLVLQMIDSLCILHENRILHRNIKLDSFLVTENGQGQPVVKLANFSHAVYLQDYKEEAFTQTNQSLDQKYSPASCVFQKHNRESPLYFAPERWTNFDLSTYLTDSFSAGLCIFLLDNSLVCSEEQLALKLLSVPLGFTDICVDMNPSINTKSGFIKMTQQLLEFQPQKRQSLRNLSEKLSLLQKEKNGYFEDINEKIIQKQMKLAIKDQIEFDNFKQTPTVFDCLYSVSLNLNNISIQDNETRSFMKGVCNIPNLSRISFVFKDSSLVSFEDQSSFLSPLASLVNLLSVSLRISESLIGEKGAQSLLSPLTNLLNLSCLTLNLSSNSIGDIGAQSLLSPLVNLLNLSSLTLDLQNNKIRGIGAQSLLCPLANLLNLSSLTLNLSSNQIGEIGAYFLLFPLANFLNLSSLTLHLNLNQIGDIGAQSLLTPLANLLNLSSLILHLNYNQIGDLGAQSLLTPLANLLNLSSLTLHLNLNQIGDIGAQQLLSPLGNLLNLSSLTLHLSNNSIRGIEAQSLLSPLGNLLSLSSLTLHLKFNQIGDIGAQSLLSPLVNHFNLSSITLNLNYNQIRDIGAQSLFYPLTNLISHSHFTLVLPTDLQEKQMTHLFNHYLKTIELNKLSEFDD